MFIMPLKAKIEDRTYYAKWIGEGIYRPLMYAIDVFNIIGTSDFLIYFHRKCGKCYGEIRLYITPTCRRITGCSFLQLQRCLSAALPNFSFEWDEGHVDF